MNLCAMKIVVSFFVFIASLMLIDVSAQEADTTWVQTYTWDSQNNPETAYDSPGRKWFDFPANDNDSSYQKILMYYNLKCFEDGTAGNLGYACGEWDYLSYSYLFDHTGELDSNQLSHPQWLIDDLTFESDTLIMNPEGGLPMDTVRWTYLDYGLVPVGSAYEAAPSDGPSDWTDLDWLTSEFPGGKMQWLWSADELDALGWEALSVSGLEFSALSGLETRDAAQWSAYWVEVDSLTEFHVGEPVASAMVFDASHSGRFIWDSPLQWNGTSHLVIECQWFGYEEAIDWSSVEGTHSPQKTWQAGTAGEFVAFDGNDRIDVSMAWLDSISDAVTLEFWQRGTEAFQPENNSICEGVNASSQREINIHLPWSNSRIYWDAGYDGGYDRIDQAANAEDYEAKWNHWAFTKDAVAGNMTVHLNGNVWHTDSNKDNAFGEMVRFHIGCDENGGNDYRGDVDEFRVWSKALDAQTIADYYDRPVDSNHPELNHLQMDLSMNYNVEVGAVGVSEEWVLHGNAGVKRHHPKDAFFNPGSMPNQQRPALTWWYGDSEEVDPVVVDHAQRIPATSVVEWTVVGNGVDPVSVDYGWPADLSRTIVTPEGDLLASFPLEGETTVYQNASLDYFSPAFDVIDRYELARFITPYGIGLTLDDDGWTWVFDVSDFAHLLRDSVELQAGNWQELLDMKFAFISGTPPRDVKRMDSFWKGQYNLASFDENITDYIFTPQEGEEMFKLRTRASGHGFGSGNNCGEFCYNNHSVKVDGDLQWSWEVMRECADNPLYPQGGTWIYDRAAWCPGAPVDTKEFELTPFVVGQDEFAVDYDITYDPDGNYRFEGQVVAYGPPNMQYDVEVSQILAPSDDKVESRLNPVCKSPKVVIRNNGADILTACTIDFGVEGGEIATYMWEGELSFMESEEVVLTYDDPILWEGEDQEWLVFEVEVSNPNGQLDQEPRNNGGSSRFHRVPTWSYSDLDDNRIIIWTKTNLAPYETSVEITDADDNIVWERGYSTANFTHRDTISLNQGCYRVTINDSGDDGQDFWANSDGSGYTRLKKVSGGNFINFEPDFGKFVSQAFFFQTNVVTVNEILEVDARGLVVFPNPSDGEVKLRLSGFANGDNLRWLCYNVMGQQVKSGLMSHVSGQLNVLDLASLTQGSYAIVVLDEDGSRWTEWVQFH